MVWTGELGAMAAQAGHDGDVAALGEDLRRAIAAFARVARQDSDAAPSAQAETLGLLDRVGEVNIAALAEQRQVTHQTMRMIVTQLEAAGWVRRHPDPADGRSRIVALSPAGREELARARARRASRIEAMIASGLAPQERDILRAAIGLLDRMGGV